MRTERNNQIRRDRRGIIAGLRLIYPGWMNGEELYLLLLDSNPSYDRVIAVRDLAYLVERGLIEYRGRNRIDERTVSVQRCEFRLTADGCDVADRIIDDPRLEV